MRAEVFSACMVACLLLVEVGEGERDLRGVEARHVLGQALLAAEPEEELSPRAVVEHEVQLELRLSSDGAG